MRPLRVRRVRRMSAPLLFAVPPGTHRVPISAGIRGSRHARTKTAKRGQPGISAGTFQNPIKPAKTRTEARGNRTKNDKKRFIRFKRAPGCEKVNSPGSACWFRCPVVVEGCVFRFGATSGASGIPRAFPEFRIAGRKGTEYHVIAGPEDRAPQACDSSAGPVAIQREGPGNPGLFLSRWQPSCDKRPVVFPWRTALDEGPRTLPPDEPENVQKIWIWPRGGLILRAQNVKTLVQINATSISPGWGGRL